MASYIDPVTGDYSVSSYFGGKDTKGYKNYKEGKASGKWDDLKDFISLGGNFSGEVIDSVKKDIEEQKGFLEKYTKNNPFVFDEELARQSATKEYEPYYDELLNDYIQGVELKRETIEDDKKLQTALQSYQEGKASRDFTRAISQAEKGFAGRGLLFSGTRARAVGEMTVEEQSVKELRDIGYENEQNAIDRRGRALDIDLSRTERDIGRQKQESIEGGVLQRRGEAITQYNVPLQQTYFRKFPTSQQNVLQGYLVPDYMRY